MDPNEALSRIHMVIADWALDCNDPNKSFAHEDNLNEMIEAFGSLDVWLRNGGFLPAMWDRKRR